MPITANGVTYSDDQIKNFFAANPNQDAVAKQAASMGMNEGQIKQASDIAGKGWSDNDINQFAQNNGYNWSGAGGAVQQNAAGGGGSGQPAATSTARSDATQYNVNPNSAGGNAQGGSNGMVNGVLTTRGGQQVTHQQLADFAASNPDDQAIMAFAQKNGMSQGDIATSLNNLGLLYNNGNPTSVQMNDPKNGSIYNRLKNGLAYGTTGYGTAQSQGTNGQGIDPLGNQITGGWSPSGNGGGGYGTPGVTGAPGIIGGAMGTGGTSIGTGTTGSTGATGTTGGSSTTASGNTGSTDWNVTAPQTVAGQLNGLMDPNNPLIQSARAKSLGMMNERGIINSSMAQTAGDQAAYSAALPIAQQDASTNAQAASFNASGKNQFGLQSQGQANTMAQLGFTAQTQKDLAQAGYLYNNLANQTATASTIQSWGNNTITAIQTSDLSADAKNAAIAAVTQYLQNSYTIQGDWHKSAADAISNIFGRNGTPNPAVQSNNQQGAPGVATPINLPAGYQ